MKPAILCCAFFTLLSAPAYSETSFTATAGHASPTRSDYSAGSAYRLALGHRFNRAFSLELSYVDLGTSDLDPAATADNIEQDVYALFGVNTSVEVHSAKLSVTGVDLSLTAQSQLTPSFGVYGRIGVMAWMAEQSLSQSAGTNNGPTLQSSENASYEDADLMFGFGANYRFSRHWGATVEVNHYTIAAIDNRYSAAGVAYFF